MRFLFHQQAFQYPSKNAGIRKQKVEKTAGYGLNSNLRRPQTKHDRILHGDGCRSETTATSAAAALLQTVFRQAFGP